MFLSVDSLTADSSGSVFIDWFFFGCGSYIPICMPVFCFALLDVGLCNFYVAGFQLLLYFFSVVLGFLLTCSLANRNPF